jgi:hypothetical protein
MIPDKLYVHDVVPTNPMPGLHYYVGDSGVTADMILDALRQQYAETHPPYVGRRTNVCFDKVKHLTPQEIDSLYARGINALTYCAGAPMLWGDYVIGSDLPLPAFVGTWQALMACKRVLADILVDPNLTLPGITATWHYALVAGLQAALNDLVAMRIIYKQVIYKEGENTVIRFTPFGYGPEVVFVFEADHPDYWQVSKGKEILRMLPALYHGIDAMYSETTEVRLANGIGISTIAPALGTPLAQSPAIYTFADNNPLIIHE